MYFESTFFINGHFSIYKEGEFFFGQIHYDLLTQIILQGSITSAAKTLGVSYQQAWHMVDRLNQMSKNPVLIRQEHEKQKKELDKYFITPYGDKILHFYEQKIKEFNLYLKNIETDWSSIF